MTASKPPVKGRVATQKQAIPRVASKGSVGAGLGGLGGGEAMVSWAQHADIHTGLGQFLLYSAPLVSVVLGTALLLGRAQLGWWALKWTTRKARETFRAQINDPNASEETKEQAQAALDEVEEILSSAHRARVKAASAFMGIPLSIEADSN